MSPAIFSRSPPPAYGMHVSVYANEIGNANLPSRFIESGVNHLRYPGGGYADGFHWSGQHRDHFAAPEHLWWSAFAGLVLVTVPTLISCFLLQRHLVKGITLGTLKG